MYGFNTLEALEQSASSTSTKKRARLQKPVFHTEIKLTDSSWIDSIQYDPNHCILDATLNNGKRYRYRGVSPLTFAHLITSKSGGVAFNELIKPLEFTALPSKSRVFVEAEASNHR